VCAEGDPRSRAPKVGAEKPPEAQGSGVRAGRGPREPLRDAYPPELSGVRQLVFTQPSGITDLGLFDLGAELENMVGAIGVSP
jgi:hypothetical protein